MQTDSTKLSLRTAFLFLAIFVVIMAVLIGILSQADRMHKENVYNRYADEANTYIAANRPALVKLFTEVFPNDTTCWNGQTTPCSKVVDSNQIAHLLPSTLNDWSSTLFLKQATTGAILALRLSGDVTTPGLYPQEQEKTVHDLLSGKRETIPWDNYTYLLNTKEVIITVKDSNNNVVGAIVRGTFEK